VWLGNGGSGIVRINPSSTPWFNADLDLVSGHHCPVMLPKAEDPALLAEIVGRTGGRCALSLIETAAGVERASTLCAADNIIRVAFGNVDLATQLGVRHDDHLTLCYARSRLVMASAAARIAPPLDGVTTDLTGTEALADDIQHARRLGFGGKVCIHPKQIDAVRAGFTPTEEELQWAHHVLEAGESVSTVDGQMVDRPVMERARRLLDP
jgi:citrate lyase subunit beta/citryl-CoA lyase